MIMGSSNALFTAVCRELTAPHAMRYLSVPGTEEEAIANAPSVCPDGYELLRVINRGELNNAVWSAPAKVDQPTN